MIALHARTYHGPGGTTLVRLVPERLVEAEDLALASVSVVRSATDRDLVVGTTDIQSAGFPAWPIITDPDNARHALNLVGDLEWARRSAVSRAGDVKKRFDLLTAALTASAPHFVPTLLEELSRIFAGVGNTSFARQYFGRARETERSHNVPVDRDRHRAMFTEFAGAGIVGAKEMTAETTAALQRFEDPADALAHVLDIMGALTAAGSGPYAGMARDVRKVAKAAGVPAADADERLLDVILTGRGFPRATGGFLTAVKKSLPTYLATRPDAAEHFARHRPDAAPVERFLEILDGCGYLDRVRGSGGYVTWLVDLIAGAAHGLRSPAPRLYAEIRRTPGFADLPPAALALWNMHPALVDELIVAGLHFDLTPGKDRTWVRAVNISHWYNDPFGGLEALAAHPELGPTVLGSRNDISEIHENLDSLFAHQGTRTLLAARVRDLAETRTTLSGALPALGSAATKVLGPLADPRITELVPEAVDTLFTFDAAEELAAALRHGLLVEFTWPDFEDAYARVRRHAADWADSHPASTRYGAPSDGVWVFPTYPDVALIGGEYFEIVGPDGVVHTGTGPFGGALVRGVYTVGDTGVVVYQDASWSTYHWWFGDAAATPAASCHHLPGISMQIPAGRLVGNVVLGPEGKLPAQGDASVLDLPDGDLVTVTDWGTTFRGVDRVTGDNLGTVPPDLSAPDGLLDRLAEHAPDTMGAADRIDSGQIVWNSSFVLPLPDGYTDPPTGAVDGRQVILSFRKGAYGSADTVLTPLGVAYSADACDPFVNDRDAGFLLALPGGGLLAKNAVTPVSPVNGAPLASSITADGHRHCLHRLPDQLWYAPRPRDPELSRRLRATGVAEARELLGAVSDLVESGSAVPKKRAVPTIPEHFGYWDEAVFTTVPAPVEFRDAVAAYFGTGADATLTAALADVVLSVLVLERTIAGLRERAGAETDGEPEVSTTEASTMETVELTDAGARALTRESYGPGAGQLTDTAHLLADWVRAGDDGFRTPPEEDGRTYHSYHGDRALADYMGQEKLLLARWGSAVNEGGEQEDLGNAVEFVRGLVASGVLGGDWDVVSVVVPDDPQLSEQLCDPGAGWVDLGAMVHPVRRSGHNGVDVGDPLKVIVRRSDRDLLTVEVTAESPPPQDHLTGPDLLAGLDRISAVSDPDSTVDTAQAASLSEATGLATATCRMLLGGVRSTQLFTTDLRRRYGLGLKELDIADHQTDALTWAVPGLLARLVTGAVDGPDPAEGMATAWRQLIGGNPALTFTDREWAIVDSVATPWQNATAILTRLILLDAVAEDKGIGNPAVSIPAVLAVVAELSLADPRRPAFAELLTRIRAAAVAYMANPDNASGIGTMDIGCAVDDPAFTRYVTPADQVVRVPVEGLLDDLVADLRSVHPDRCGVALDPGNSVPELVEEVASAVGVGRDAARYFLQVLALSLPSDANVRRWNGWRKKDIEAAGAELVGAGLVVQAQRSGAGRGFFLPGGWLEGRGGSEPAKPLEVWKAPLYLLWEDVKARPVLVGCPPHVPVSALFGDAWRRYCSGDVPGYEELTTTRYRSGRRSARR